MRTLFLNLRSVESFQEILELQEVVCKIVMAPLCILLGSIPTAFIRDLKGSVGFTLHTLLSKKKNGGDSCGSDSCLVARGNKIAV